MYLTYGYPYPSYLSYLGIAANHPARRVEFILRQIHRAANTQQDIQSSYNKLLCVGACIWMCVLYVCMHLCVYAMCVCVYTHRRVCV